VLREIKLLRPMISIVIIRIGRGQSIYQEYPNTVCGTTCPSYHHDGRLGLDMDLKFDVTQIHTLSGLGYKIEDRWYTNR